MITARSRNVYLALERVCARRRVEVEKTKQYLLQNGHTLVDTEDAADATLLFACAFNNCTEKKSLERLRELARGNNDLVVLDGLAAILPGRRELMTDMDEPLFVPVGEYRRLDDLFFVSIKFDDIEDPIHPCDSDAFTIQVGRGCRDTCAYCGDKIVVGDLVSKPLADVAREAEKAAERNVRTVNLLGDDVGAYGLDIGLTLADLMDALVEIEPGFKIRMQEANIKYLIRYRDRLAVHIRRKTLEHIVIAFQSGCDRILGLMERGYKRNEALSFISLAAEADTKIRFHALVGFPTETNSEFRETLHFVRDANFDSGTFFIYQDRETAKANDLCPKVSERAKLDRIRAAAEFCGQIGMTSQVEFEDKLQVARCGE